MTSMAIRQAVRTTRLLGDCVRAGWSLMRMPGRSHRGLLPAADDQLRTLAFELRRHVAHLAESIGERNVRHRPGELARAAEYIASELALDGGVVERQEYDVEGVCCANVEIERRGTSRPDEIIVIGAHYDTVPGSPGANDNASGVASVLCLARRLAGVHCDRTIRFVAFVNEEAPYAHTELMGSWVYARRSRQREEQITAMISLETIGYYSDRSNSQSYPPGLRLVYPSMGNFIAFVGTTRYSRLVREAVRAFRRCEPFPSEGGAMPEAFSDFGRSDHWPFWQEGYPAIMVTDTAPFRYPHYHTPDDTVDKIDFERTARVTRGLCGVIRALSTAP